MAASPTYFDLALNWQPAEKRDDRFLLITAIVVSLLFAAAFLISSIELPKEERLIVQPIPERIAEFIEERPKPPPPPPVVEEKPKPPPIKPKPTVERQPETKIEEPLTEKQQEARDVAQQSGLLALSNELADLFDTADVSDMVGAEVNDAGDAAAKGGSLVDEAALTSGVGQGSGGVDSQQYAATSGTTRQLSARERLALTSPIAERNQADGQRGDNASSSASSAERGDHLRGEEEVALVFDKNKSKLYSLYNRARRSNPMLKGKLVFELTIAPDGTVTNARIISSELNDKSLETRLLARIKQFVFAAKSVEPVTVTFPVEFLPS